MKKTYKYGLIIIGSLALALPALAQNPNGYVQTIGNGQINWTHQYIEVVGSGVPPSDKPAAQGRLLAQRAAMADAYRQLAETIYGVRVDAETTVRDFVTESDVIKTQVQGVIKGAQIQGRPRSSADGATEVTLRLPLFGPLASAVGLEEVVRGQQNQPLSFYTAPPLMVASSSLSGLPWQMARCQRFEQAQPVSPLPHDLPGSEFETSPPETPSPQQIHTQPPASDSNNTEEPSLQAPNSDQAFTGLIIDARGLGLMPSMSPVVKDQDQQVYIGKFELDIDRVINEGVVIYFTSLEQALQHPRAGQHPLIVKAVGTNASRVNFVLHPQDGAQIRNFNARDRFLEQLQVVAVL